MPSVPISVSSKKQKKKSKHTLKDLQTLGHQLLSSRAHINNLPRLLTFISPSSPPHYVLESLLTLQSFFTPLVSDLPSSSSSKDVSTQDPELVYKTWLRSKFDEFMRALICVTVSSNAEETVRDVALDAIMEFVKLGKDGKFQTVIYHRFLKTIVLSNLTIDILLDSLASRFFKYMDICYFTYISLHKFAKSLESTNISVITNVSVSDDDEHISEPRNVELAIHKIHYVLSRIPPCETQEGKSDYEMWSEQGLSLKEVDGKGSDDASCVKGRQNKVLSTFRIAKKMKLKFTNAWLSFLRLPLPLDVYKEILVSLHQTVIPYLSNPVMLTYDRLLDVSAEWILIYSLLVCSDFLTRSYDIGGVISVMALSSLFILMTQHGLEYPNFYEKLYLLLVPSIFMAKHRAKFFQLLDSCLKSPLLPAYLAAAFTKKLSRLALVVPPSGALVIIALIHNLLRRHPSINFLVHWQTDEEDDQNISREENESTESVKESGTDTNTKQGIDLFDPEESNPAKSNAMRSSLWEIETLRNHYCPAVSRFVESLESDLTVRSKTTEITVKDFCSGSYSTIFGDEIRRRIKQVPLAFYKTIPSSLFSDSDFSGWTFPSEEAETKS